MKYIKEHFWGLLIDIFVVAIFAIQSEITPAAYYTLVIFIAIIFIFHRFNVATHERRLALSEDYSKKNVGMLMISSEELIQEILYPTWSPEKKRNVAAAFKETKRIVLP